MNFSKKLWLFWNKLRFLTTPVKRRIRLELETDGRQITYLLVSLHSLGYAVHVVKSPMVFRELLSLKRTPLPFVVGGIKRDCSFVISDRANVIEEAVAEGIRGVYLDYNFFSDDEQTPRMPYFMHPSVYYQGLDRLSAPPIDKKRPIRIGFFGTRDAIFYTRDFKFPMLNREEILEQFFSDFGEIIQSLDTSRMEWPSCSIAISVDERGGDRPEKSFLPPEKYHKALRECDFILSPPGWCIPISHNLIEAMASGAIPIINSAKYLHPCLEDGINCLTFSTRGDLKNVINKVIGMQDNEVKKLRKNVYSYFRNYLEPQNWLDKVISDGGGQILVNAEEISLGM